jgi:transcription elongation factor
MNSETEYYEQFGTLSVSAIGGGGNDGPPGDFSDGETTPSFSDGETTPSFSDGETTPSFSDEAPSDGETTP